MTDLSTVSTQNSKLNCMDRWNELIAGFVLGNLSPEEAETIARVLAENPQLASNITRLRSTATVRSLRSVEWTTARSQDGSEGWADTALDLPNLALLSRKEDGQRLSAMGSVAARTAGSALSSSQMNASNAVSKSSLSESSLEGLPGAGEPRNVRSLAAQASTSRKERSQVERFSRAERFSLVEALLVPVFNPLWWLAVGIAVAVSFDSFKVRRSLSLALEELAQLRAVEQPEVVE